MLTQTAITEALLIACAALTYAYFAYPRLDFPDEPSFYKAGSPDLLPRVSMIIAAYNEERDLQAKLENSFGFCTCLRSLKSS
jgi:cellulose synthase/poly-beta-1,6-N-acetylglucosamine synthase-like glycosyltransferase